MHSSQFGITFTDSRGPVNSDGPIHCIRSLNRMVRYSVMPLPVLTTAPTTTTRKVGITETVQGLETDASRALGMFFLFMLFLFLTILMIYKVYLLTTATTTTKRRVGITNRAGARDTSVSSLRC